MNVPVIEGYEISTVLGQGGMGAVFLGRRERDGEFVAIKVMRAVESLSVQFRSRLKRELAISKSLAHPYVVKVLDGGLLEATGEHFIVMEYLGGDDLESSSRMSLVDDATGRRVIVHLAEALSYLHARKLVHRDIKPANILVESDDRTGLLDFGLAYSADLTRLTATNEIVGTFAYMAPEQLSGEDCTSRTDIYGLGVTMYRVLTGQAPYDEGALMAMAMGRAGAATLTAPPSPHVLRPEISPALARVVMGCIELDRGRRYADGDAVASACQQLFSSANTEGGAARPSATAATRSSRRVVTPAVKTSVPTTTKATAPGGEKGRRSSLPAVLSLACFVLFLFWSQAADRSSPPSSPTDHTERRTAGTTKALSVGRDLVPLRAAMLRRWPPSEDSCAKLGAMLARLGVLARFQLAALPQSAGALYYLAQHLETGRQYQQAVEAYLLVVERYGPSLLPGHRAPETRALALAARLGSSRTCAELFQRCLPVATSAGTRRRLQFCLLVAEVGMLEQAKEKGASYASLRARCEGLLAALPNEVAWSEAACLYIRILAGEDTEAARDRLAEYLTELDWQQAAQVAGGAAGAVGGGRNWTLVLFSASGVLSGHYSMDQGRAPVRRHVDLAFAVAERAFELAQATKHRLLVPATLTFAARCREQGKLKRAQQVLASVEPTQLKRSERLEYFRARGRLCREAGDYAAALGFYRQARQEARDSASKASIDDDIDKVRTTRLLMRGL